MFEQDFIKRAIRQLIEVAARALGMAPKQTTEALEMIAEAKGQLPFLPGMLDTLSPANVLQMFGGPGAALALFRLYEAEAAAYAQLGDEPRTRRCQRRAVLFFLEADPDSLDDAARSTCRELAGKLAKDQLRPAQWRALGME